MWYAIVDADTLNLTLKPENGKKISRLGEMIKVACREQFPVNHPEYDYPGVDIMAFISKTQISEYKENDKGLRPVNQRNTVVMTNKDLDWDKPETWTGMIDRSPTGSFSSAMLSVLYKRKLLKIGEEYVFESIIGTQFIGKIIEEVKIGKKDGE